MENSGFRAFPNLWNVTPLFPSSPAMFLSDVLYKGGDGSLGDDCEKCFKGLPTLYSSGSQSFLVALENLVAEIPPSI